MVDVDGYGPPRGTGLSRERAGGRYAADLFWQLPARVSGSAAILDPLPE
jgi:hypothetical protein